MASSIHGESRQYQVDEMFMLLESLDQKAVDEVRKLILDDINSSGSKESWLLSTLVEHYLATKSKQVQDLFPDIADSQCKYLLERLNDGIRGTGNKLALLQLLLYIVCKQPYWTHRVVEMSVFTTLIKCLKTETDIPVLMTAVMIITVLLPVVPITIAPHLTDILDIFSRLASFCVRKPANTPDIFLLHLHVALYSLFHRLYGMYPYCLLNYIQHQFTKKDLIPVYDEILKPMLERVRLHPQLISGSKDSETSMNRWKHLETQDIVIECAKLSLDMIEGTWDDVPCPAFIRRYQAIQEAVRSRNNSGSTSQDLFQSVMNQEVGVIFTSLTSDPSVVCSPSVVIGLSTPPQSQRTTPATSFLDNNALVPSVAGTISNTPMMTPQDITPRETPNITYPVDDQSGKNSSRGQARSIDSRRQSRGTSSLLEAKTTPGGQFLSGASCVTSPLKTEFTQEPPKGAVKTQPRNAIRVLEFDGDRQSADVHKRPLSTQNSLERKVEGQNEISGDKCTSVTMNTLINVVEELSTNENECIDDEVSHFTQEENLEGSFESVTCPETQQVTAESVKQFMKKVNRIRFNSLNNPERLAVSDGKRFVRSTSCPPFEEEGAPDSSDEVLRSNSTAVDENQLSGIDSTVTLVEKQDNFSRVRLEKSRRSRQPSGNNVEKMSELLEQMSNIPPFSILSQALFTPTKVQICSACQSKLVVGSQTINTQDIKDEIPLFSTFSPPELLDRQLKIGGDLHAKELNKIPLTSKESVNWTHFGGVPPADEVNILKGQICLLHNQVMYERQKRELHAKRNRRLLRKITQTKTLEEQNRAMAEQRKIHEQEIQNLTVSLRLVQEENQAFKQEKESNNYEDLVKLRTTLQTNKDLEEANIGLKNLLITQREDHDKLKMQWQTANSQLSSTVKELDILKEQVVHNQKLKEQVFKLQKEVLLMGELQQKYHERLHSQRNSSSIKPEQNYLAQSLKAEKRVLKEKLNEYVQKSEKLGLRVNELEEQTMNKEKAMEELKQNLENTKVSHADEVRAVNEKYEAMVRVNQQFEAELLNLQSQVDVLTQKCLLRKRGSTSDGGPTTSSKSDWSSVPGGDNSHKSDADSIKTVKPTDKGYCDHKQVMDRNCSEVDFSEQRPQSHSAQALDSLSLSSQDGVSVTHGGSKSSITYTDSEDNRSSHSNVTTDSGWWEKSTVSK